MSMHEALFGAYAIPEATCRVAQLAFPKGNVYMQIRDHCGMLYQNHQFAHLFATEGQPAGSPARLALVTVMQYVGETLRHTLNRLAIVAPDWLRTHADRTWVDRYAQRVEHYRLPKHDAGQQALASLIGQDGYRLLEACFAPEVPTLVRRQPAVETLRRVWIQQYYRCDAPTAAVVRPRGSTEQPPSAQIISSPYDPDARYKTKRDTHWVGYKAHLTETCDHDAPHLISHVATTPATSADCDLTAAIHTALAAKQLLPSEHNLDIGSIDAELLVGSQSDHQVRLVGPVSSDPAWQAHTPKGSTLTQFGLDWEAQQAVCPEGKLSRWWSEEQDADGNATVVLRFRPEDCRVCARHSECTKAKKGARGLRLRPREQHQALQAARTRQQTVELRQQYARRAGVEGRFTQANAHSDLGHARYIGLAKVHLQHLITAIALNLIRASAWLAETPRR